MATFDEKGREILDQTPVALPLHFDRPEPLHLRIRRLILQELNGSNDDFNPEEENDFSDDEALELEDRLSPSEQFYLDVTRPPDPPVDPGPDPSPAETIIVPES